MKLAILSRNSKLYSTRRLVEAARQRGHTARVLDPLRCYMRISSSGFQLHYKGRSLADYDATLLEKYDALGALPRPLRDYLPEALVAGTAAGELTAEGAALLGARCTRCKCGQSGCKVLIQTSRCLHVSDHARAVHLRQASGLFGNGYRVAGFVHQLGWKLGEEVVGFQVYGAYGFGLAVLRKGGA